MHYNSKFFKLTSYLTSLHPSRFVLELLSRLLDFSYTFAMRSSFASWGAKSKLGRHSKLVEPQLIHVGNGVSFGEYAWLNAKNDLKNDKPTLYIGDDTYIGRFVQINAWQSVNIGRNVLIADRVLISDADHNYDDCNTPIIRQGDSFNGCVSLKDGCWIGIGVVVLPNVTIGQNAVVAANSVVTQDVPDFAVAGGIPAKIIKQL
jgi:acetyltransferase-like isoleucine patch superfamily enzyme